MEIPWDCIFWLSLGVGVFMSIAAGISALEAWLEKCVDEKDP